MTRVQGKSIQIEKIVGDKNVVKSNKLNTAIHNLTLQEMRLIQLAIVSARESGQGLHTDKPLRIHASQFAEVFNISLDAAYKAIKKSEKSLFERYFRFVDAVDGNMVKGRWIQQVKYLKDNGAIELIFTSIVVNEIANIEGAKQFFTQYALKQTAPLKNMHTLRLYELVVQWLSKGITPVFELETLREQLQVQKNTHLDMGNFKSRVLHKSIVDIKKVTNLSIEYEQVKAGRKIVGFRFYVTAKGEAEVDNGADNAGADKVYIALTEKQAIKFSRVLINNPSFSMHIPAHYKSKEQKIRYLKNELQTHEFVSTYKEQLIDAGFNFSSGAKVDSFSVPLEPDASSATDADEVNIG